MLEGAEVSEAEVSADQAEVTVLQGGAATALQGEAMAVTEAEATATDVMVPAAAGLSAVAEAV